MPDAWPVVRLGVAYEVQLGKMLAAGVENGSQFPYLANRNVKWGHISIDNLGSMNFSASERSKYRLRAGDLLLCEGGEVGRAAIWSGELEDCYFQNALHRLRPRSGNLAAFCRHYIQYAARQGWLQRSSSQTSIAHLSRASLIEFPIPAPPQAEQRRIAEVLDTIDDTVRCAERTIRKQEVLYSALSAQMIADAQHGYEQHPLSEVVHRAEYGISTSLGRTGAIPVLRMGNIQGGKVDVADLRYVDAPRRSLPMLESRDLLFNRTNSMAHVGKACIWRDELPVATFASYLVRLHTTSQVSTEFLNAWLNLASVQREIRRWATPAVQQVNISPTRLLRAAFAVPSLAEQVETVQALNEVERQISAKKLHLTKLQETRAGLANDLLSGRVRVPA